MCVRIFFFLFFSCNSPWLPSSESELLRPPMNLVLVPVLAVVEAVEEAVAEVGEEVHTLLNHPRILKLHLLLPRETSFW